MAKSSEELSDTLAEDAESAADLAIEITKMNQGVEELAEGFEDWSSVLKKSSKTSAEYSKAMSSMKSSLSKVLDVEEDLISSDFVNEHLEDIEKAAKGDAKAIDSLRAAMDEEVIANITLGQSEEFINNITTIENKV
jgi:methyl-accepting chemotaxis protein